MPDNRFKTALDIQDACNLTAVAGVFHKMCLEVLREKNHGTDAPTKDPAILWVLDKMNDLCGRPASETMSKSYDVCLTKSKE